MSSLIRIAPKNQTRYLTSTESTDFFFEQEFNVPHYQSMKVSLCEATMITMFRSTEAGEASEAPATPKYCPCPRVYLSDLRCWCFHCEEIFMSEIFPICSETRVSQGCICRYVYTASMSMSMSCASAWHGISMVDTDGIQQSNQNGARIVFPVEYGHFLPLPQLHGLNFGTLYSGWT